MKAPYKTGDMIMRHGEIRLAVALMGGAAIFAVTGCQRPAGQNGTEANVGGNQALSQNPNAMSESGMPRTGNTSLNDLAPNASNEYSNGTDDIAAPR